MISSNKHQNRLPRKCGSNNFFHQRIGATIYVSMIDTWIAQLWPYALCASAEVTWKLSTSQLKEYAICMNLLSYAYHWAYYDQCQTLETWHWELSHIEKEADNSFVKMFIFDWFSLRNVSALVMYCWYMCVHASTCRYCCLINIDFIHKM